MTPSPPMPARRSASRATWLAHEVEGTLEVGDQHEVVLRAVALGEGEQVSHGGHCPRSPAAATATARTAGSSGSPGSSQRDPRVGPEPRLLAAREPAGAGRGLRQRLVLGQVAVDLRRAPGRSRWPARGGAAVAQAHLVQGPDLVEQALGPHPAHARVDPRIEDGAGQLEADGHGGPHVLAARHRRRERATGQLDDLEGSHDASGVVGLDGGRRRRVEVAQPLQQRLGAEASGLLLQPPPDAQVGGRDLEPVERRTHVEAGAADQQGVPPAPGDRGEVGPGAGLVCRDAGLLGDVEHVELVVRDAAALAHRQLGRADVHAAVELRGVGADDLAAQHLGEGDGEVGLAGGGRADDGDDERTGRRTAACPRGRARPGLVAERVAVDARHPRVGPARPSRCASRVFGPCLRPLVVEPVDVEEAVEVVVLVLQHPREPAGRLVARSRCRRGRTR